MTTQLRAYAPTRLRAYQQPNGRTSYLREGYPPAVRASPTTNHQPPTPSGFTIPGTRETLPRAPLHHQQPTTNHQPNGRTSTRRKTLPQYALHHQPPTTPPGFTIPGTRETLPRAPLHHQQPTTNH
ncbi:MAG: hypothetical protein ACHBN1_33345 [Heteroscytonema crispum UTEX LB 1556]